MQVAVFSICHNEAAFLPYFFRHYRTFADYITIIDNNSTDDSLNICKKESNFVSSINTDNSHRIDMMTYFKNNYWKLHKNFDWIFIVDIDEIIYHHDMRKFLEASRGYTVLKPTGYQMFCDVFPTEDGQITEIMPFGVLSTPDLCLSLLHCDSFDKKCVINPKEIEETNYTDGMHQANMIGNIVELSNPNLKLLHYRFLGLDYVIGKNKMRAARLVSELVNLGFSTHYLKTKEELTSVFQSTLAKRELVI
jgi:hypothetical protein